MVKKGFAFQHLETEEDIEQNLELMRKVFWQEPNVEALVKKLIYHHSTMTLKDFFIIKHQGKIVASLNLIPEEWSIGGIPLRIAEMGCVGTLAKYRHRGLQRRLVKEFHKQAEEQEYDLCAIEGIPYFYRQFGYEYAIPLNQETLIKLEQIPECKSQMHIRPFTNEDIPKAMQLLTQNQSKFYVHSIRREQIWKMQQETCVAGGDRFEGHIVEKDGKIVAYFRIRDKPDSKELILSEATDTGQKIGEAILRFLKDTGKQRGFETLNAHISHHDTFVEQLVALGAVKIMPPYAWQIRVIDYVKIFQKLKPLFEKRLATSTYHHLTESLNFNFYRYTIRVMIENGVITAIKRLESNEDRTIRANSLIFTQLLLGHRSREELEMIYPDFIVRPSRKQLIDTLFPKLPSHVHSAY